MGTRRAAVDDTPHRTGHHDVVDTLARGRHHLFAEAWEAGAELPRDSAATPTHRGIRPCPSRSTSTAQSSMTGGSWTTSSALTRPRVDRP